MGKPSRPAKPMSNLKRTKEEIEHEVASLSLKLGQLYYTIEAAKAQARGLSQRMHELQQELNILPKKEESDDAIIQETPEEDQAPTDAPTV